MKPFRILIYDEMHPSIVPLLREAGCQPDYQPGITREEALAVLGNYEGLVGRSKFKLDKAVLDAAPSLRLIGRSGAGLDDIDLAEAARRNITIVNAPEGNRDAVAEHAMGLLLNLLNNISRAHNEIAQGQWLRVPNRGHSLMGKTVGLIGYGNMGRATAARLQAFGCQVLAYDKYLTEWPDQHAQQATMEEIWQQAQIVSLHLPLTEETRYLVDSAWIQKFEQPIWLINTARGKVVRLDDLAQALESGKVLGAGLDVLENEKPATWNPAEQAVMNRLLATGRVIITPHIAGWTHESYHLLNVVLVQKIARWLADHPSDRTGADPAAHREDLGPGV